MKTVVRCASLGHPVRRWLVLGFFVLIAVSLGVRACYLQLLNNTFLKRHGEARTVRVELVSARRGDITDRNGEYLAVSTPIQSLWCRPRELLQHPEGLRHLARLLDTSFVALTETLKARQDREFFWLRRHVPPELAGRIMQLALPGLHEKWEYRRYYPNADVTTHVVGFTDIDEVGREGMELAYDEWLRGRAGKNRVLKDRLGRTVEHIENVEIQRQGRSLALSIDVRIQYLAWSELLAAVQRYGARSGSLVMLDVQTGEALAVVSYPSYNPNHRAERVAEYYRNRPVTDVFEPGSTLKPFTVLAALQSGHYSAHTPVDTSPGYFNVGGHLVRDIKNYGVLDVTGIIRKSSNVGASRIALSLERPLHWSVLTRLGFGQQTGSAFPGEASGNLPHHDRWSAIGQATLAFGYGMSASALQLARAYSLLANDGKILPVSFVKLPAVADGEQRVHPALARQILAMMEEVVSEQGTGKRAAVRGYRTVGKTGTVRRAGREGYQEDRYLSLFAGAAPASRPRLALVVVIEEPRGEEYYGGQVAAPVFSGVMGGALRIMGIPSDAPNYDSITLDIGRRAAYMHRGDR